MTHFHKGQGHDQNLTGIDNESIHIVFCLINISEYLTIKKLEKIDLDL